MFRVPSISGLFKWRQFEPEVILLAVGWYLRFSLSYRDVEELLAERGLHADHVTVWRWVQRYAPEMERRLRSRLKPTTTARHSGPSSNKGDRVLGCFLPFFEVVTADVTGPAATWSTCSTKLGAIGLRQIAASSSLRWLWDYKQPF
jgi:hypothetical protein